MARSPDHQITRFLMPTFPPTTLWNIFDARRVKQPELRGVDLMVNGFVGWFKNRKPVLAKLRSAAETD